VAICGAEEERQGKSRSSSTRLGRSLSAVASVQSVPVQSGYPLYLEAGTLQWLHCGRGSRSRQACTAHSSRHFGCTSTRTLPSACAWGHFVCGPSRSLLGPLAMGCGAVAVVCGAAAFCVGIKMQHAHMVPIRHGVHGRARARARTPSMVT
jgi:hypothetical protein